MTWLGTSRRQAHSQSEVLDGGQEEVYRGYGLRVHNRHIPECRITCVIMRRLKHIFDLPLALLLLYLSYWVYAVSNYLAYSLAGLNPSIPLAGLFPAGVSAVVGPQQATILVKVLQVLISCTVPFAVLLVARVVRLPCTVLASITILSIFIASFYWEVLSPASGTSLDLHTIAFAAVAAISQYSILRVTKANHIFS